ncbi:SDR family oxidoreductase [Macrococcoides caseolyticum]|uniref:SDR family oxidoreductase n=1 Tax=Macrococcoides caseolyticum TaxID=69966 RepID=UPI001F48CAD4|nr:SDR family oxidoreductase [Macrococcus caseolyticus]MCE4956426.1 SDR family oxidoreductase [Macrococcus caseolyticus]
MKTLIIGANGQVGKQLVEKLAKHIDITPIAVIRKAEQKAFFDELNVETRFLDLEEDLPKYEGVFTGVECVIFTAGSGGHTGADKTMLIDLDAAVKSIDTANKLGVKRFVMVSSFDTTRAAIQEADSGFRPYVVAKHYADNHLRASGLDYTILHPGILSDDAETGKVKVAERLEVAKITRADVAEVLKTVIENDDTIGQEFQVINGDVEIEEAIKANLS